MFTGPEFLETLRLSDNEITDIQNGTFNPTPHLSSLRLSNNTITMFPFEELSRNQISTLYLDNNQMTTLPSLAYDILTTISDINIDNNPWQCDCRMVEFRLKMTGSYPFENQINCSQPEHLNGQKLIDISPDDMMSSGILPTIARFERVDNMTMYHGDTLYFVCEASGIPTPDITVILPSGLNATLDANGTITITNVTAADAGLYVCIAVNPAGSTFATMVIDLQTVPTTVSTPLNSQESNTYYESTTSFSSHVSVVPSPSKQPSPSFSLPILLGAVCGSVAGTLLIGGIILAFWCTRNNQGPPKRPDFSVVFNNTNTTATVITNGQDLTTQAQSTCIRLSSDVRNPHLIPQPPSSQFEPYENVQPPPTGAVLMQTARGLSSYVRNPHLVPRPASFQFEPYEDVQPPPRGAVPSQTASSRGQALRPPVRSNNEPPPVPPPRTASATGYDNIPEHTYQTLTTSRNRPDNGDDTSHHYQSLRRT
ncbi:PREDICTED: leucine-rich repeat and immunoglobulin-like domain-containing nogo receptor-interacting protein 1 [Branchiostoma belcheri]|uniref:Leucine-rich repeat and immunoglobulin-like domain-containing nogo receptor-interacting protein 1 n=1 Tax=Branchiostoma belcheri TaxID=7741 RepID=A0A6P4ZNH7_BRABE|nr:PREDICTED: leucine-rich repeat and immunoglobulin-like domain-containing nogo receptor-interacting protein 1 [Branchiostoma belcheri]